MTYQLYASLILELSFTENNCVLKNGNMHFQDVFWRIALNNLNFCHLQKTWTRGSFKSIFLDVTEIPVVSQNSAKDTSKCETSDLR